MFRCLLLIALHCNAQKLWEQASEDNKIEGIIRKVYIIYRHGHREPIHSYPKDPYVDSEMWKNGPGHLTILGRQQAYNLGQNLRSRYLYLLPEERAWKAIRSLSSCVSRSLMSSAVVLSGLIPPTDEDRWSSIDWQPAATFTSEILSSRPRCPKLEYLLKSYNHKPNELTRKLYDYISEHTGTRVTNPTILLNIYNCLEIQRQAGLALPIWTYSVFKNMKKEAAKSFRDTTEDILRLLLGPLLKKVSSFNVTVAASHPMSIYSTHENIIGGLLSALKFNISEPPNFTSAIVVEYREVRGKFHAQLWYRNSHNFELIRLPWPDCGIRCPLDKLEHILKPFIPDDWASECVMHQNEQWTLFHCVLIILFFFVVAGGLFALSGSGNYANKYES